MDEWILFEIWKDGWKWYKEKKYCDLWHLHDSSEQIVGNLPKLDEYGTKTLQNRSLLNN
jgi:hypothetical protein